MHLNRHTSLKSEMKTHDLNHDLTFSANTINCVCHSIRSMFRVLGIHNFAVSTKMNDNVASGFVFVRQPSPGSQWPLVHTMNK